MPPPDRLRKLTEFSCRMPSEWLSRRNGVLEGKAYGNRIPLFINKWTDELESDYGNVKSM